MFPCLLILSLLCNQYTHFLTQKQLQFVTKTRLPKNRRVILWMTIRLTRRLPVVLFATVCVSITAGAQTYSTRFEGGEENPLSDGGKWRNAGLDWTSVRKSRGLACGTQTGTNTGARQYDDSYAHLAGFPPDQEAWGQAHIA